MKKLGFGVALLLLTITTATGLWTVGEMHRQGCLIDNFHGLEVTDAGKGAAVDLRVNPDGSDVFTLHAQFPSARLCERWPF